MLIRVFKFTDKLTWTIMGGEVVLVAVDASKEITDYALEWAVLNVVKAMDSLILLAVLPTHGCPPAAANRTPQSRIQQFLAGLQKKWGLRHDAKDSPDHIRLVNGVHQEGSHRINEVCVQMMRELCSANNVKQVQTKVKVVPEAVMGSVATKAEELGATWVILDRRLKKEGDCCLKQLDCNIVIIDHAIPKFLKSINSPSMKKINLGGIDPTVADMLGVFPNFNRESNGMTTPSNHGFKSRSPDTHVSGSLSSTDNENFHGTRNSITKSQPAKTFIHQNPQPAHSKTQATNSYKPSYSKSQPLNKVSRFDIDEMPHKSSASSTNEKTQSYSGPLKTKSVKHHFPLCGYQTDINQDNEVKLQRKVPPIPIRRSTDSPRLRQNIERANRSKQLLISKRESKNGNRSEANISPSLPTIDRTSSIRRAMSLSIKQPPTPPPLCSVCKHNAPIFGKAPRKFGYQEIERATDGFSAANFLAVGGYGPVYKGVLPNGQVVAVKQHKVISAQGASEFCSEVEVLSCAQHRNLVMLVGYCIEVEWLLVYEFSCNGSLDKHLYGTETNEVMTWHNRMKVAIGAARGLRYLHEDCRVGCIVHRDLRPNNILLTHDFEPMVGDFGLARWQTDGQTAEETRVIGAFGYLAPEYTKTGLITEKADVYAFGVVLIELLSGLKATDLSRSLEQQYLPEWAHPLLEKKIINEMIDPLLDGNYIDKEVESMMYAACLCISPYPERRPRMSKVLRILEGDIPSDMAYQYGEPISTSSDRDMAYQYGEPISTSSDRKGKNNHNIERSLNQTQDYSLSDESQPMHNLKLSLSSSNEQIGNKPNTNIKPMKSMELYGTEELSNSQNFNQTEQLVSQEYQAYLQGSLVEFIHKMNDTSLTSNTSLLTHKLRSENLIRN